MNTLYYIPLLISIIISFIMDTRTFIDMIIYTNDTRYANIINTLFVQNDSQHNNYIYIWCAYIIDLILYTSNHQHMANFILDTHIFLDINQYKNDS